MKKTRKISQSETNKNTKKGKIKKLLEAINTYVSIFALIVSVFTFVWTYSLQNKTLKFSTYNMDLSYHIKFSDEIDKENVSFFQEYIQISAEEYLSITPKTGGIYKIALVLPQANFENDFDIHVINMNEPTVSTFQEAQDLSCTINTLTLPISDSDDSNYYSSMIFVFEDYKHNLFTNLIVFEIDKNNLSNIDERIYDESHLLLISNKTYGFMPDFDLAQLKRYLDLKKKFNELNIDQL